MRLVLKAAMYLLMIGVLGILAYAVFSDLPAPNRPVELPVEAK